MRPQGRSVVLAALGALALASPAHADVETAPEVDIVSDLRDAAENPECTPEGPRADALRISVLPEEGDAPFTDALAAARTSIRILIYEMGEGPILDLLERKAESGVRVQVILDGARADVNRAAFTRLRAAGARVHWSSPRYHFTHAKTMILDGAVALIATGNYDDARRATERDYVVRDADAADVAVLDRLFSADWKGKTPDLRCTRLVIAPVNARPRLLGLIASARQTIDIESTEFSDEEVRDAVLERAADGARVRVILADPSWIAANVDAAALLASHGIEARFLRAPGVHVKAILVDGRAAYTGSVNLSYTSISKNREIGLVTTEAPVLTTIGATFEGDWARAGSP